MRPFLANFLLRETLRCAPRLSRSLFLFSILLGNKDVTRLAHKDRTIPEALLTLALHLPSLVRGSSTPEEAVVYIRFRWTKKILAGAAAGLFALSLAGALALARVCAEETQAKPAATKRAITERIMQSAFFRPMGSPWTVRNLHVLLYNGRPGVQWS